MSFTDKDERKSPEEECYDVLQLGFKMIQIIAETRERVNFDRLKMRIGIHTVSAPNSKQEINFTQGEIIGGVVGTGIIRFDMYGQDVVIANKMESEGVPDKVKVSRATKDMLEKYVEKHGDIGMEYEKQEDVFVKKLGRNIENYIVEKNDFFDN